MVSGEAIGVRVLSEVRQPDRFGLADHEPKDPMASRQPADARSELGIDPVGGKALQDPAVWRDHPDGRIAGADHLGAHLHHALEDPFHRDLGDKRRGGPHEPLEPFLC
jgi:hypothetical protein